MAKAGFSDGFERVGTAAGGVQRGQSGLDPGPLPIAYAGVGGGEGGVRQPSLFQERWPGTGGGGRKIVHGRNFLKKDGAATAAPSRHLARASVLPNCANCLRSCAVPPRTGFSDIRGRTAAPAAWRNPGPPGDP